MIFRYFMTDLNQSFTKIIQLGLAAEASHQPTFKVYVKVTFHRVMSVIVKSISTKFSSRMLIPLPRLLRLCAGLHFFIPVNCLLNINAPNEPKIAVHRYTFNCIDAVI